MLLSECDCIFAQFLSQKVTLKSQCRLSSVQYWGHDLKKSGKIGVMLLHTLLPKLAMLLFYHAWYKLLRLGLECRVCRKNPSKKSAQGTENVKRSEIAQRTAKNMKKLPQFDEEYFALFYFHKSQDIPRNSIHSIKHHTDRSLNCIDMEDLVAIFFIFIVKWHFVVSQSQNPNEFRDLIKKRPRRQRAVRWIFSEEWKNKTSG